EYASKYAAITAEMSSDPQTQNPDAIMRQYRRVKEDLVTTGQSADFTNLKLNIKNNVMQDNLELANSILADTRYAREDKVEMLKEIPTDPQQIIPDVDKEYIDYSVTNAPTYHPAE